MLVWSEVTASFLSYALPCQEPNQRQSIVVGGACVHDTNNDRIACLGDDPRRLFACRRNEIALSNRQADLPGTPVSRAGLHRSHFQTAAQARSECQHECPRQRAAQSTSRHRDQVWLLAFPLVASELLVPRQGEPRLAMATLFKCPHEVRRPAWLPRCKRVFLQVAQ